MTYPIFCRCCGVEIPTGTHCIHCDPVSGVAECSFTMVIVAGRPGYEVISPTVRERFDPRVIWQEFKDAVLSGASHLYGAWLGHRYVKQMEHTPTPHGIMWMMMCYKVPDVHAGAEGFVWGYNTKLEQMQEEEAERETWGEYSLWQRYSKGYYTTRYPLYIPCFLFSALLSYIAMFTTGSFIVVLFIAGLAALTIIATNTVNFFLCIREEQRERT